MCEMRILNEHGDEKVEWDPADQKSVNAAQERFNRLKKDGYEFYEVTETRGKPVRRWDRKLGKLIAAPGARSKADREVGTRPRAMAGGPVAGKPVPLR